MATRPRKLLFAALACGLVLGAGELTARWLGRGVGIASIPDEQVRKHLEQDAMRYHPELGWVRADLPNPGLGINAAGFRHPDVAREKPPGTWRAFALGDSQTYGAGVDAARSWPSQAEALLRAGAPGRGVELINAGISGYTSLQVLRLARLELLAWAPDALIVDCRTHDSPREDLAEPTEEGLLGRLTFHSRLFWALRFGVQRLLPGGERPMRAAAMEVSAAELAARFGNHEALVRFAAERGISLLFLDYPFWDASGLTCLAPARELPAGAAVAPACEALRATGLPPERLFLDNNHLSDEGNARVAEVVAGEIRTRGWVAP